MYMYTWHVFVFSTTNMNKFKHLQDNYCQTVGLLFVILPTTKLTTCDISMLTVDAVSTLFSHSEQLQRLQEIANSTVHNDLLTESENQTNCQVNKINEYDSNEVSQSENLVCLSHELY